MKKWERLQRGVEKACFSISHNHAEFLHSHAKWNRMGFVCSTLREKWKAVSHDHAKFSHNRAKSSRKMKIMLMDSPLPTIVRNCWGSCETIIFSRFLVKEASRRPLGWCQVSTWPWPINRNLIDSFKTFFTFF